MYLMNSHCVFFETVGKKLVLPMGFIIINSIIFNNKYVTHSFFYGTNLISEKSSMLYRLISYKCIQASRKAPPPQKNYFTLTIPKIGQCHIFSVRFSYVVYYLYTNTLYAFWLKYTSLNDSAERRERYRGSYFVTSE